jgi:hypothetical protein
MASPHVAPRPDTPPLPLAFSSLCVALCACLTDTGCDDGDGAGSSGSSSRPYLASPAPEAQAHPSVQFFQSQCVSAECCVCLGEGPDVRVRHCGSVGCQGWFVACGLCCRLCVFCLRETVT